MSEWFWRFLAVVMMVAAGWAMWIFYQLSPPAPLATSAAFEAAEKAGAKQNAKGVIVPVSTPATATVSPTAPVSSAAAVSPTVPEAAREPPVNTEKLKFSDSIANPEPATK